jgi:hypothetical protein
VRKVGRVGDSLAWAACLLPTLLFRPLILTLICVLLALDLYITSVSLT